MSLLREINVVNRVILRKELLVINSTKGLIFLLTLRQIATLVFLTVCEETIISFFPPLQFSQPTVKRF